MRGVWARSIAPAVPGEPTLLFRLYIPSARLYAAEASQMLAMFRDWLMATSQRGVRIERSTTALGHAGVAPSLQEEIESSRSFVWACKVDPDVAVELLVEAHLGRAASTELVRRFRFELEEMERKMRKDALRTGASNPGHPGEPRAGTSRAGSETAG